MAQYAELYFAESEEDIPINRYLMKLAPSIRNQIIKWKLGLKYEAKYIWGVKGEEIQLPMTYTMYKTMPCVVRSHLFKKIEKRLLQRDITHVILPKTMRICPFQTIQGCTGNYIRPFFIMDIIRFISKHRLLNKDLKDLEIIILDGSKSDVYMIIDFIYPYINYLTIITNDPARFENQVENIFDDVGLNIQVLSYNKTSIAQGDIIIDTHYDDPSVIHFCKKNAVYLDMGNHIEKTAMLLEKQNKIPVIDEFFLTKNDQVVSTAKAEVLLTIANLFSRDYQETMRRLKKEKIEIKKLF